MGNTPVEQASHFNFLGHILLYYTDLDLK